MSIWSRIREFLEDLGQNSLLSQLLGRKPEESVAFTIAIIALSAKMAKADGIVTRDEVIALRQIFEFDERDEADIAKVFDLARQDVAGFEEYAKRIRRLFEGRPEMLEGIFEGLFQIAMADHVFHENEEIFLERVREIFNVRESYFFALKARYVSDSGSNPLSVLGLNPDANETEIRTAYRQIIRDCHPDRLRAQGLPEEAIAMAENRVRAVNVAFAELGLS